MGHELTWTAVVTQGSFAATRLEGNRANKIRASIFQQPAKGQQQEEDGTDSKPNNLRKNLTKECSTVEEWLFRAALAIQNQRRLDP